MAAMQMMALCPAFLTLFAASRAMAENPAWPVKVSPNGRYFVGQDGKPIFWLGTTQWELFHGYTLEDARTILHQTRSHGFTFVQVMLLGVSDGTKPNVYGEKPWINDNPLTPNEAYFRNVDAVVKAARAENLTILLTTYHQSWRKYITVENARAWTKWVSARYKDAPNMAWTMNPQAKEEFIPVIRELVAGLREGDDGRHLISAKPDPSPFSSSFVHPEPLFDFNAMQTWNAVQLIYPMVTHDYQLKPVKPVLMAEGAYEAGSEYGFEVTPLWVRRQAYYSYLAGAHHTYGHNDSWRVLPSWKSALDAPGAQQMGILRKVFEARAEWWLLVPDQSVFAAGGQTEGDILHLAARHQGGKWAMLYLADKAEFTVDLGKLSGPGVGGFWCNPQSGEKTAIEPLTNKGVKRFSTPEGWEDALLILESKEERR
jgi:hypothetical protein